jgi:hypothetical protein
LDDERWQQQVRGLAQVLAIKALVHPPDQRDALITRAVARIRREHEQRHGADLDTAAPASRLLNLTRAMLRLLEESGGCINHA